MTTSDTDSATPGDTPPTQEPANGTHSPRMAPHPHLLGAHSAISGVKYRKQDMVSIGSLRPSLAERIRRDYPDLTDRARIGVDELARYRMLHIKELLEDEHGEFSDLDQDVADSISKQDTIAEDTEREFEEKRTFGDRVSDQLARFGGSWSFLISFACVLAVWMAFNIFSPNREVFDPYPFILLNLMLSCLAAVQAPIIMMSQKRQDAKDRERSNNAYKVNLKAELEIRNLHEKLDSLLVRHWERLSEIESLQNEMMRQGGLGPKIHIPAAPPETEAPEGQGTSAP